MRSVEDFAFGQGLAQFLRGGGGDLRVGENKRFELLERFQMWQTGISYLGSA